MPFNDPVVVVVIPATSSQSLFLEYPDERGNSDHNDDTREWQKRHDKMDALENECSK